MPATHTRSQKNRRARAGRLFGQGAMHVVLIVVAFLALAPFLWLVTNSFKTFTDVMSARGALWPKAWTLENYQMILERGGFPVAMRNSILVVIPTTLSVVLTSVAAGYVFAKYRFWGKETFFMLILGTMMVPFAVVVIPLYLTVRDLHLMNKIGALIITGLFSTFGIFLMRQAIEPIPNDYIDAARVDGASEEWIFLRVIVPLSLSASSALLVLTFLGTWDNFMFPSIIITSPGQKTLPLVLAGMRSLYNVQYQLLAAGSMLTVVPVMVLFTLAQRTFIRGLAMTGLKG